MADGKIHSAATIGVGAGLLAGIGVTYLTNDPVNYGLAFTGILLGILIGPDQDVDNGNISDYYLRKLFRLDILWGLFWASYRLAFRHRSFLSHGILIGTFLRVCYLFFPLVVILFKNQDTGWLAVFGWGIIAQIMTIPIIISIVLFSDLFILYAPYLLYGLFISDTLHILFDR